jgi:hypothetical protein
MRILSKIIWKPCSLWLLLGLVSCQPADVVDYGFGKYYVEIVTALDNHAFLLDNGQTVHDSNRTAKQTFAAGDRVYLHFSRAYLHASYDETLAAQIIVHSAGKIFSHALQAIPEQVLAAQADEPLSPTSAWIGSHYLNLFLYMEFRSEAHKIALLTDKDRTGDPEVHLYLRHDRNNDSAGYPLSLYASYDLSPVLGAPRNDRTLFLHITTASAGEKIYTLTY